MKKILVFLYLIPAFGMSQPVTNGLVGYWPFNSNANDESGNGNNGVVHGATLVADRFGNANSAYYFNNTYISIESNSAIQPTNSISLSLWAQPENLGTTSRPPLTKRYAEVSDPYNSYIINVHPDKKWGFCLSDGTTGSQVCIYDDAEILQNEWCNIIVTYDGTIMKLYVGGILKASSSVSLNIGYSSLPLRIGTAIPQSNQYFEGVIDDVMIFNRALSESEIQTLSNNTQPQAVLCNSLYCDGENLGIGTSDTKGYKLAVAGNIITEEVKVALQPNWPDFVFKNDYALRDLADLEDYIKTNQHLPNIPDAEFVAKEGYNLGEMDSKLLEKIEELTLYLIEQNKRTELLIKEV